MSTKLRTIEEDIADALLGVVPTEKLDMALDAMHSILTEHLPSEFTKARHNEPVFVLRAQDASAARIIKLWLDENEETLTQDKRSRAESVMRAMQTWHVKKAAD